MSSTNHTTNYNLSQFLGTDKPAWLGDYNSDMSKIDTAIKNAADTATGADGKADANATKIGDLTSLTTTAKTDTVSAINEVNSLAGTAQGTANSASQTATNAYTKAETAIANTQLLNLTSFTTISAANFQNIQGLSSMGGSLTVACNSNGSVFKVYGTFTFNKSFGGVSFTIPSNVRPDSNITISPAGIWVEDDGYTRAVNLTVATNGNITVTWYGEGKNGSSCSLMPCLYFAKDFGDEPVNQ